MCSRTSKIRLLPLIKVAFYSVVFSIEIHLRTPMLIFYYIFDPAVTACIVILNIRNLCKLWQEIHESFI